jgi:hypothetical protein
VFFKIIGKISDVETVASTKPIKEIRRLRKAYGSGRPVGLADGTICYAEVHWYEAHGIGPKEFKIKWIVADHVAAKVHQIRVIDKSGVDYLYPEEYFAPVQPDSAERAIRRTNGARAKTRAWFRIYPCPAN